MNWAQLRYRLGIGGLPWGAKTAWGVVSSRVSPPAATGGPPKPREVGAMAGGAPRVLYIHAGWAIETVGRLWFSEQDIVRVSFVTAGDASLTPAFMDGFDLVWYGYSSLYGSHPCNPAKAVLAIHDPAELFPARADWKSACGVAAERAESLRGMRGVVVISLEMQEVLARAGVPALRIPTCSQVDLRDEAGLRQEVVPAMLGVGRIYRRKNFEQFNRIAAQAARRFGMPAYLKSDHFPLADDAYLALLDRFPIYVCTSYQEGGPLPVKDAMRRGAVVLSSSVGQVPEIIEHGANGFMCSTDEEFLAVLESLAGNPAKLLDLRLASLRRIQAIRDEASIKQAVDAALESLLAHAPRVGPAIPAGGA